MMRGVIFHFIGLAERTAWRGERLSEIIVNNEADNLLPARRIRNVFAAGAGRRARLPRNKHYRVMMVRLALL